MLAVRIGTINLGRISRTRELSLTKGTQVPELPHQCRVPVPGGAGSRPRWGKIHRRCIDDKTDHEGARFYGTSRTLTTDGRRRGAGNPAVERRAGSGSCRGYRLVVDLGGDFVGLD